VEYGLCDNCYLAGFLRAFARIAPDPRVGRAALVLLMLAAICMALAPRVRAEIWGYVDENGVAHMAAQKLDDRYRLFFRGDMKAPPAPPAPPLNDDLDALMGTALYRRLADNPNIARYEPLILANASAYADRSGARQGGDRGRVRVRSRAVSDKGALGLMQVMAGTGARYGVIGRRAALDRAEAPRSVDQRAHRRALPAGPAGALRGRRLMWRSPRTTPAKGR
jgi:hypothetical protein